jgi:pimeloyl-ACP methyl ester carboxylesterase
LVHGIGTWSYSWRHNIDVLSQYFRVICWDATGYGFSDKPMQVGEVAVRHQIEELARVMQSVCDAPAIAVAESLGALVTLATAAAYPALFERLVVMNVPIFPHHLPSWGMRWMAHLPLSLVRSVDHLRLARATAPLIRLLSQVVRREIMAEGTTLSPEDRYWLTYPYTEFPGAIATLAADLKQYARDIYALQQGRPSLIREIQIQLHHITQTTLILWGEQDRWFPVQDGQTLHSVLPNSVFQVLPNCAHQAASGCPDLVNAAILDFLLHNNG